MLGVMVKIGASLFVQPGSTPSVYVSVRPPCFTTMRRLPLSPFGFDGVGRGVPRSPSTVRPDVDPAEGRLAILAEDDLLRGADGAVRLGPELLARELRFNAGPVLPLAVLDDEELAREGRGVRESFTSRTGAAHGLDLIVSWNAPQIITAWEASSAIPTDNRCRSRRRPGRGAPSTTRPRSCSARAPRCTQAAPHETSAASSRGDGGLGLSGRATSDGGDGRGGGRPG